MEPSARRRRDGRPYNRGMDFETRAIHDGQEPDPATGAVTVPIYQTSTYVQEAVGVHKGYDYSRVANPTRTALQKCLASLESAEHGIAFSSGLGATTTLMHLVDPGQRVVLIADVYGGVYRMTSQVYEPKGYQLRVPAGGRVREPRDAPRREHAHGLDRDAVEPAAEHRRHPRRRRRRARGRRDARRRQHLRDAVPPAAARARRRRRRALDDEVPRRPLRHRSAASRRPTTRRSPSGSTSCRSRSAPCPARSTAGSSCAASRRSPCGCASTARTPRRSPRWLDAHPRVEHVLLPRPADASRARDRDAPDARLRRHGLVPRRVGGGSRRARRAHEALPARRVARRRREPDRGSGAHDARVDRGRAVRGAGEPRPPLGRDRVGRRPDRRPRDRARPGRRRHA